MALSRSCKPSALTSLWANLARSVKGWNKTRREKKGKQSDTLVPNMRAPTAHACCSHGVHMHPRLWLFPIEIDDLVVLLRIFPFFSLVLLLELLKLAIVWTKSMSASADQLARSPSPR